MLNVVIVDDEESIRLGLERILAKTEHHVRVVGSYENGLDALEGILKQQPDEVHLVITDIKMPKVDGLKLIQNLHKKRPHLKFVILSGFNEFEYARHALRHGVIDYLLKPIDLQELRLIIAKFEQILQIEPGSEGMRQKETSQAYEPHNPIVELAKAYIDKHYEREISRQEIADEVFVSPHHLSKLFKNTTNEAITDYMIRVRVEKAKQLLEYQPEMKVFEVGALVGYSNPEYFSKVFKKWVGMTPGEYKMKCAQ